MDKVSEVYDAGKQAQYDEFWDTFQNYGKRTNYQYAFFPGGWSKENFRPKYSIKPVGSITNAFYNNDDASVHTISMSALEKELGIEFDFSGVKGNTQYAFRKTIFSDLNVIDLSNATDLTGTFYSENSTGVSRIERLILNGTYAIYGDTFGNCKHLTYVGFEGTIEVNNLNLQWSTKLERESLLKLIDCLADKSADTSGTVWKITLGSENIAKLTDDELKQIKVKGWTYA